MPDIEANSHSQSNNFDQKQPSIQNYENSAIINVSEDKDDLDSEELEDIVENVSLKNEDRPQLDPIYDKKRVVTASIPIRNFSKALKIAGNVFIPNTPRRDGLGTARTARRFKNNDTQREIMGNVWIDDLHHKEEQNNENKTKHGSFGQQAKNSTNYEDELNLDDYEALLRKSNESPDTKFTKEPQAKYPSNSGSIFSMYEKQSEDISFSSLNLSDKMNLNIKGKKKEPKVNKVFDLEISAEFSEFDLNH